MQAPLQMRPVPGHDGYYVTNTGKIWSTSPWRGKRGRWLRANPNRGGYLQVTLMRDGRQCTQRVHSLVAHAFHGPRPFPEAVVRHRNGQQTDNRAANLTWGTQAENNLDAVQHGTHNNASKTECVNGHPLEGDNLRLNTEGHRRCVACKRVRHRVYRSRAAGRNLRDPFGRAFTDEPAGRLQPARTAA